MENFEAILAADLKEAMRQIAHEQAQHEIEETHGWIALGRIPLDKQNPWE